MKNAAARLAPNISAKNSRRIENVFSELGISRPTVVTARAAGFDYHSFSASQLKKNLERELITRIALVSFVNMIWKRPKGE